jgi:glycosyltransferase involved in cell wall biosynthesis
VLGDVEFLPHLAMPHRAEFLRGLTVLSVPERFGEAGGRYVKEALACGVPVVQPQNVCFPELLAATGGGLLFTPGDVGALAQQLTRILTEPGLAEALGRAGQAGVSEHFSAARSADKLAAIFRKVIQGETP